MCADANAPWSAWGSGRGRPSREILAFPTSHDRRLVRINGHYPVIDDQETTYYSYPAWTLHSTDMDSKDKSIAFASQSNSML